MARLQLYTESLPLSSEEAFRRLGAVPHTVFLDSAIRADGIGRFSILACDPLYMINEPEAWRLQMAAWKAQPVGLHDAFAADWPFYGGWVGYMAYEYYDTFIPQVARRVTDYPALAFAFYDSFLLFDHQRDRAWLASLGLPELGGSSDRDLAKRRIAGMIERLEKGSVATPESFRSRPLSPIVDAERYTQDVGRIQDYIRAGDCYQVNYTQRFEGETQQSAPELYRRLRALSPAPMAAYLDIGNFQILSASPESFLRIRDRIVQTRPIKGTRPRGDTPAADERLKEALYCSEKDRAELLMITDLERNDLGRVCVPGTVETQQLVALQTLEQVHHLYSLITGQSRDAVTPWDVMRACFPGGSITGAPKIRAMQIIRQLEPHAREVYTGTLGFLSVDGSCQWNIPIRTMIYKQGHVTAYAGGAIVADSDPEEEYEECLVKLEGMRKALDASVRR